MSKNLTKNFEFLMESKEFDEKETLIKWIGEIEIEAKKEQCDMSKISNFRHIYHELLKMYCKYGEPDKSLLHAEDYEQWNAIIKFCTQKQIHCFKRIKDIGNIGSHDDAFMADPLDVIHYLKSLYLLLKDLLAEFKFIKEDKEKTFDKTCYTGGVDKTKQAFSNKTIKKWEDESTKINQTFIVQRLPIVQLLNEPSFIFDIPIYQRGYSWEKNNIDALIKDIEKREVDDLDHYFGVIAYKMLDQKLFNTNKTLSILDGQQRLTTSAMLLCATRDALKKKGKVDFIDVVAKFKNPAGREIDNETFEFIKNESLSSLNKKHMSTNYYKNYQIFYNYLLNKTCDEIISFYNAFKENFRVGGIEFKSISKKTEMEIFENLNSKGKSLTTFELTKNFIFNLCSEDTLIENENDIVVDFNLFKGNTYPLQNEKAENVLMDFFESLIHYTTGEELENQGKDIDQINYLSQLDWALHYIYKIYYGEDMPDNLTIDGYKKLLDMLRRYLKIYLNFYNPNEFDLKPSKVFGIQDVYQLITKSAKKNPLFPSIYFIFDTLDLDKESAEKTIDKKYVKTCVYNLIKYLIWHDVVSGQGESSTARKFWQITYDMLSNEKFASLSPIEKIDHFILRVKDEIAAKAGDWKAKLSSIPKITWAHKALLIILEWELLGGINSPCRLEYTNPSWEHIMPQEYDKWKYDLKLWNPNLKDDEITQNHIDHVHKLGNAMRLPKKWNSQLSNKPFMKKIEKLNSIADFSSPLYRSRNNKIDVSNKTKWNFEEINIRHNELVKIIEEKVFK